MMRAKDIMSKDPVCVSKDTPVYEAAEILLENQITGMPVLAEDGTLAGIITEKDLLRLYHTQDADGKTVEEFMTRPAVCCKEDENWQAICNFRLVNYFRRIPVTSKGGRVAGIVSRPDILRQVMKSRRAESPAVSS